MEIAFSIIGKIAEYAVEPVIRELGYLCFIRSNMQELKGQVEMLKETRELVQHMVCSARRNAEDIKPVVENWLTKVDAIIEKSEVILVNEGRHVRLCSNLVQRHRLSRKAKKMADVVLEMKRQGDFDQVSYNVAISFVESSLTKKSDFLNFGSRELTMEQIMDALLDDNVNTIGVYGMGGVGKTMLVQEISRKIMEKRSFDEVVITTVSQTPDLKRIQGELADKLGLEFNQETVDGRALKLYKRLKIENSILIVFDDIWDYIDLETIGIPIFADRKGCKILFTSRDKHVLSNEMCINKLFEIKVLEEDESWNLFKKTAGEIVETYDLKPIAIQIAKECSHLPIAITTVAKALRNKPSSIWKDALDQLNNPVIVNIRGMNKKVYSSLKLSYEYLECEELKLLFLFCSMFPEDFLISVEALQVYAMSMGFLHGVDTMAQGRRRVTKLVDDLISSSLLLQSKFMNTYVKMHDIVRDVAILIASTDDQIRTLSYVKRLNKREHKKMSGNHTVVYLDVEGFQNTLQKLMLPKVQFLMLHGSLSDEHELTETFFEEMKELKGLELESMKVSTLPPSLYSSSNVRLLHLISCELGNIDVIGELKKLEILSFERSNIIQIPTEIGQLTHLKVLDLSSCHQLKVIPPNILSRLTKLEELFLETFSGWEGEESNKARKNASLTELRYLPHLSTLSIRIQDEKIMPKQLFSRELNIEKFKIAIGSKISIKQRSIFLRILGLEMESGSGLDDWIKMLLKRCDELYLVGSMVARILQFELDENESSHLKSLHLSNDSEFQHFIHQQSKLLPKILSNLELLELSNFLNLETVIHGHIREVPFNKLRSVRAENCKKLGSLFNNCMLDNILNLEEISVWWCEMLEAITVMESNERSATIEFTHLKSLSLHGVPRLRSFCSKIKQVGQSSLDNSENVETRSQISNDSSFFSEEVLLPNLKELEIKGADNLRMIWPNILISNSFSKLFRVEIKSCNNFEKIFPSNMMSLLTSLKFLTIKNCNMLKGIFEVQESNATEKSITLLSNLRGLELFNLPSLEYVWSEDSCELMIFENVKLLSIQLCPKLKRAYPVKILKQHKHLRIDVSQLKETLEKAKSVRMLDSNQFETSQVETTQFQEGDPELFSKLKTLEVYGSLDCNSTDHLPMEIVRIVHNLERFGVRRMLIKEIFPNERLIKVGEHHNTRSKPWELDLFELPKLTHLWKDDFKNTSPFQNLSSLTISRCGILDMLVPSSVSFENLSHLRVNKCHRLTHFLNPSVARTLVKLKHLVLEKCKRMTTVIAAEVVEEGNDEITFNKLEVLVLNGLSKLTSFHSGKCIIKFPCLNKIATRTCPEIKVFSLGVISTPKLLVKDVYIYNDITDSLHGFGDSNGYGDSEVVEDINGIIRQVWEDNYDTGIQYLFVEKDLEENQADHSSLSL